MIVFGLSVGSTKISYTELARSFHHLNEGNFREIVTKKVLWLFFFAFISTNIQKKSFSFPSISIDFSPNTMYYFSKPISYSQRSSSNFISLDKHIFIFFVSISMMLHHCHKIIFIPAKNLIVYSTTIFTVFEPKKLRGKAQTHTDFE